MMAGIYLGGKYLGFGGCGLFFLLLEDYKYNYMYDSRLSFMFNQGMKETCRVSGMKHAAPVILAFWSYEE